MPKKKPGYNTSGNPTTIEVDGRRIDFEKTNKELAPELGMTPKQVGKIRFVHARHTLQSSYRHSELDFSKSTKELANELGITESNVRRRRKLYAPHTVRGYVKNRNPPPKVENPTPQKLKSESLQEASDTVLIKELSNRFSNRFDHGLSVISQLLEEASQRQRRSWSNPNSGKGKLKLRAIS